MSEALTIEKWQEQFKKKPTTGTPVVPTQKETDVHGEHLDRVIAHAKRADVLKYKVRILPVLYEMDRACAIATTEMIRSRTPEDQTDQFNAAWEGLKRLIYEIETQEVTNGKKTNQLEA